MTNELKGALMLVLREKEGRIAATTPHTRRNDDCTRWGEDLGKVWGDIDPFYEATRHWL